MAELGVTVAVTKAKGEEAGENQDGAVEGSPSSSHGLKVRLISEWLDCCCTSGSFGSEGMEWVEVEGKEGIVSSVFSVTAQPSLESEVKVNTFNNKPGIYAIFLSESGPVGFTYVDCSSFILEGGQVSTKNTKIMDEYSVDMTVTISESLLPLPEVLPMEPVFIDVKSICGYPLMEFECMEEAVSNTYLFGELNLGGGKSRPLLGFPFLRDGDNNITSEGNEGKNDGGGDNITAPDTMAMTVDSEFQMTQGEGSVETSNNRKFDVNLKICMLPGLIDIPKLKDSFTSSTLIIELHRDDVSKRAFHARNVEEYLKMSGADGDGDDAHADASHAPPAKKGGGKGGAAAAAAIHVTLGPTTEIDQFLLGCITRALTASRQIRPHGTIRYRLEQLLSSSNDLLTRFARRRHGGAEDGDDVVVVSEEMFVEVRLEKPSKPEKWDLPADMSLRSALRRAKLEAQSKLDGTMAATASATGTGVGTSTSVNLLTKPLPRHERFLTANTGMELTASLHRKLFDPTIIPPESVPEPEEGEDPLSDAELAVKLSVTPFTRMVVLFKYLDDDTLKALNAGINEINSAALPDIQGTIRSYSFNEEELTAAKAAKLDVITGFMVLDDDMRLVVLEGLAKPSGGMQRLFTEFLPRVKANDDHLRILCNPEILFPERIYPEFGPDIRRIRVRDKLKKLARRPEVYNRKQVEEICFLAIDGVMALRRAMDMQSTKKLDMYPSAEALSKLELLYGEAITRPDMDGSLRDSFIENYHARGSVSRGRTSPTNAAAAAAGEGDSAAIVAATTGTGAETAAAAMVSTRPPRAAYVPTECRNPEFEAYLCTRPVHKVDFMKETREMRQQAWLNMLQRRNTREEEYQTNMRRVLGDDVFEATAAQGGPKVYLYSTQSQNFKAKAFNELRSRVATDKNATYTFSKDFVSQTVCVVDESQLAKNNKIESANKMLTKRGFQYPKPKTRVELITHPQRPSDARIEDLRDAFKDALDVKANAGDTQDPELRAKEKGFKTQIQSDGLFGQLKPVTFQRPFQLKLVGDRSKLPRGGLTGGTEQDPNAFRSVHLGGEGQAKIVADAMEAERKDWLDKVVVDHTSVKVGGFKIRDRPIQMDRTSDMLKDAPKRKELIHLRQRASHLGADWSYQPAPISILNADAYVSNAAAQALVRTSNPDKFITTKMNLQAQAKETADWEARKTAAKEAYSSQVSLGGASSVDSELGSAWDDSKAPGFGAGSAIGEDFSRFIHKDAFNTKLVSMVARRKHPPQDPMSAECKGPKWDPAGSKRSGGGGGGTDAHK